MSLPDYRHVIHGRTFSTMYGGETLEPMQSRRTWADYAYAAVIFAVCLIAIMALVYAELTP